VNANEAVRLELLRYRREGFAQQIGIGSVSQRNVITFEVCQFFCVKGLGFVFGMGLPTMCQLILKGSGPFSQWVLGPFLLRGNYFRAVLAVKGSRCRTLCALDRCGPL